MFCYNCGRQLSEHDFCTSCGADVSLYKKIMYVSNMYYNEGLEKAEVRDLAGAITSLRQSLKFNKNNIEARNLLGLVYFETGEVVAALSEWVISKNLRPEKNIADDYIERLQSNAARLDAINQTIKKYNQALVYCQQDSKDLAVIQLKKVLSLNSRFVRAHQLLALLYIDNEQWEKAERELKKCLDIDRNNTQTLRYLKEVELMLIPDETVKQTGKRKKEDTIRYVSDNEMIIQPLSVKEPKNSGVATLVNLGIGLLIGLAVTYFLMVPSAEANARSEAQRTITEISNQSDAKTSRIQELENENNKLMQDKENLQNKQDSNLERLKAYDDLLAMASDYLTEGNNDAAAAELERITGEVSLGEYSEGFEEFCATLLKEIGPELSARYYDEAYEYFRKEEYGAAIESFQRAAYYDPENEDACYFLARAYQKDGNKEQAIATYQQFIIDFPNSPKVLNKEIERYLKELGAETE
ncbi:MAG: tetratricopeptide repeat protein [Acetatifactor sp.]